MKFSVVVMVFVLATAPQLFAAPVVVRYEATIETVEGNFLGFTHALLTPVMGSFLFDTSVADSHPSLSRGDYQHSSNGGFTATFQASNSGSPLAVAIVGSGSPEVRVEWFPTLNDTWRYLDGMPDHGAMSVNGSANSDVDLHFAMSQAVLFASDANTNPWPLVTFTGGVGDTAHTFSLSDSNGTILLQINSIEIVPEPGSFAMLLFGSVMMWFFRRERSV